jgi:hypothetical protein
MTAAPKPTMIPEEMQRRRVHVRTAIAENRIEGIATGAETLAILEAYIRGEIEAGDLVTAYRERGAKPMIDWSQRDDAERIPGKLSGAWCVKGTRLRCEDITGQYEAGCSAEESQALTSTTYRLLSCGASCGLPAGRNCDPSPTRGASGPICPMIISAAPTNSRKSWPGLTARCGHDRHGSLWHDRRRPDNRKPGTCGRNRHPRFCQSERRGHSRERPQGRSELRRQDGRIVVRQPPSKPTFPR